MLQSMTMIIRLIHVDQLEKTLYLCYGVKYQSGVIWDPGVKRSFSIKILELEHVTFHEH